MFYKRWICALKAYLSGRWIFVVGGTCVSWKGFCTRRHRIAVKDEYLRLPIRTKPRTLVPTGEVSIHGVVGAKTFCTC